MSRDELLIVIEEESTDLADAVKGFFKAELEAQGYRDTGTLIDSIDYEVKKEADGIVYEYYMADYGLSIDQGVPADKIPYSPGSGAASNKMIEGLIGWFRRKGLGDREAIGASHATARSWLRTGRPGIGSLKYSNNGRRTGFIGHAISDNGKRIEVLSEAIISRIAQRFEIMLDTIITAE